MLGGGGERGRAGCPEASESQSSKACPDTAARVRVPSTHAFEYTLKRTQGCLCPDLYPGLKHPASCITHWCVHFSLSAFGSSGLRSASTQLPTLVSFSRLPPGGTALSGSACHCRMSAALARAGQGSAQPSDHRKEPLMQMGCQWAWVQGGNGGEIGFRARRDSKKELGRELWGLPGLCLFSHVHCPSHSGLGLAV